jgi:hypothetical protein
MLFCLIGFVLLSAYLNPYWLQLKFRQVARYACLQGLRM